MRELVLPNGVRIALIVRASDNAFVIPEWQEHPATVYQPSGVRLDQIIPVTESVIDGQVLRALIDAGCHVAES